MKLTGFIKEYNDIEGAITLESALHTELGNIVDRNKVLNYLKGGHFLLGWMGYFFDVETKEPIDPDSYYTDGVWVWPSYLPYYIKKYPNFAINHEFLEYMATKGFKCVIDDKFKANERAFEKEFASRL